MGTDPIFEETFPDELARWADYRIVASAHWR